MLFVEAGKPKSSAGKIVQDAIKRDLARELIALEGLLDVCEEKLQRQFGYELPESYFRALPSDFELMIALEEETKPGVRIQINHVPACVLAIVGFAQSKGASICFDLCFRMLTVFLQCVQLRPERLMLNRFSKSKKIAHSVEGHSSKVTCLLRLKL